MSSSSGSSSVASNIIVNHDFSSGLAPWRANNCHARVVPNREGGNHAVVTDRKEEWQGLKQDITGKVSAGVVYSVYARVRVSGPVRSSGVEATLRLESRDSAPDYKTIIPKTFVSSNQWQTLEGQFLLPTLPNHKIVFYLEGPPPEVNLLIDSVLIERAVLDRSQPRYLSYTAVRRKKWLEKLRSKTDEVRKRDVILKFYVPGSDMCLPAGTYVNVQQIQNSFPIGSCINHEDIYKKRFVPFFLKHFNWAVFQYELKWDHTEEKRGIFTYENVDKLLDFCRYYQIKTRGHCILWEEEEFIQEWVQKLSNSDLRKAILKRLEDLLTRYKGQFEHYDVNNEMVHEKYYKKRLKNEIRVTMYETAKALDPTATLFVNDYIENVCDTENYYDHICDLISRGAPVEGVGIQGHIHSPKERKTVCRALDRLGELGLPIWLTELEFSHIDDESIRAENMEVMLRTAFAHPAVEGIMFWGNEVRDYEGRNLYWDNEHWLNAEGGLNETGRRLLQLKKEWMSNAQGHIDNQGQFMFRGFPGSYKVEIGPDKIPRNFIVDKGSSGDIYQYYSL